MTGGGTLKLAACRWKNIACSYGRLRRTPKLPTRPVQSSESSSATEDMTEDEESSSESGCGGEENEYEMDSKDLCIEIKLAKDSQVRSKCWAEIRGGSCNPSIWEA